MIATLQRWGLVVQLALSALIAVWLASRGHASVGAAIAIGVAVPLVLHAALLTLGFTIAWAGRGERPADEPGPGVLAELGHWTAAWLREIPDSIRTFGVAQPLLSRRPFGAAAHDPARMPVLLLHGYFCNRGLWRRMAPRLIARGHPVEALDLEPPFASIDDYAPRIAEAVDALRRRTGAPRIALVAHSMGGLAARAYLRAFGDEAIACVVTLGTPHQGTVHARLGRGRNVRQMRRGSDWLRRLAAEEPAEGLRKFTVVLSRQDNIVAPQAVQTLPGATTVTLHGLGHISLACDPRVARIVHEAIESAQRDAQRRVH